MYSIQLVADEHPDWDDIEVYLQARKQFNISAVNFFSETLKILTSLRPKVRIVHNIMCFVYTRYIHTCAILDSVHFHIQAKWGFYGLPMNFYEPCEGSGTVRITNYIHS